jgi:toxin ParE1/3/4
VTKVIKAVGVDRDLAAIWDYIAVDNPEAAKQCLRQIDAQFGKLARFPLMGRVRSDLSVGLRSFPIGNYIIFYLPITNQSGVYIVRVIEGHRDISPEDFT